MATAARRAASRAADRPSPDGCNRRVGTLASAVEATRVNAYQWPIERIPSALTVGRGLQERRSAQRLRHLADKTPWPGPPRGMRIGRARLSSALGAAEPVGIRAISFQDESEVQGLPGPLPATTSGHSSRSCAQSQLAGRVRTRPHNRPHFMRCHDRHTGRRPLYFPQRLDIVSSP